MKETKKYFVVTKNKIAELENNIRYENADYDKYIKLIEDYEIDDLTEKNIKAKIDEYNFENEKNIFNRLKMSDFIIVISEELSENKIKVRQIRHFELSKK